MALDRSDVVRMLDLSFGWSGLLTGERIITSDVARAYDFHRAGELIQLGRETAERHLAG